MMVMGVSAADRLLRPLARLPWIDLKVPFAELSIAHVISALHMHLSSSLIMTECW